MAGSFLDFGSLETGSGGSDGEDEKPRRAAKPKRSRKFPPPEMDPEMIPDLRSLLVKYKPRSLTHAKAILKEAWDGIPRSEIPRKESAYIDFVKKMNPKVAKKYRHLKWTNKERMDHVASLWNKGIADISEAEQSEEDKDEDEAEQSEEDKDKAEQSEEEHGEDEEEIMVDGEVEEHGEVEEEILVEEELPVLPVLPFKTTKQEKHKKKEEKERKKEKKERKKEKKERKKEKKEKKAKKEKSSESESESESEPEQELFKKRKFEATKM